MTSLVPYRIDKTHLRSSLRNWDRLMRFKIRLIACGGTALTLLDIKESTKDVDFIVPDENEFIRLIKFLQRIGYKEGPGGLHHDHDPNFLYQFWCGNRVFTTDLFLSPLEKGQHIPVWEWKRLFIGALNLNDLIMTKLFRGTNVDIEDCVAAFKQRHIDPVELFLHFKEAASYDLNPIRMMDNFYRFADQLREVGLLSEPLWSKLTSGK